MNKRQAAKVRPGDAVTYARTEYTVVEVRQEPPEPLWYLARLPHAPLAPPYLYLETAPGCVIAVTYRVCQPFPRPLAPALRARPGR